MTVQIELIASRETAAGLLSRNPSNRTLKNKDLGIRQGPSRLRDSPSSSARYRSADITNKKSFLRVNFSNNLVDAYLEMRPLFFAAARPMNVEWKIKPYFGVLPLKLSNIFAPTTPHLLHLPRSTSTTEYLLR